MTSLIINYSFHNIRAVLLPNNCALLQFNFEGKRTITGIYTQGRRHAAQWVTSYTVAYSNDGLTWTHILNNDGTPKVRHNDMS